MDTDIKKVDPPDHIFHKYIIHDLSVFICVHQWLSILIQPNLRL
jgi:hypothetical protein